MVERQHPALSVVRQCRLLGISRSGLYYRPVGPTPEDLTLMQLLDQQYLATPFYGSRRMTAWLRGQGYPVSRKRVQRLMRAMGLQAIYRRPRTSQPAPGHQVHPYLLLGVEINRANQVRTLPTYLCAGGSSTWWSSWTGIAGTCWPGGYPIPWMKSAVWMPWPRH